MSFQAEEYLGRIRRSWWSLVIPFGVLFLTAGVFSYFSNRQIEPWQQYVVWSICALAILFFWLVPIIRHLSFYLDLSTSRLVIRRGIFGGKTVDLSLQELQSAVATRSGKLQLLLRNGETIEVQVPGRKKLAETINNLLGKRQ